MRFKNFYTMNEAKKSKYIVIYSGRFQPFHIGHKETYDNLVKKFGKENVYIATSDKVEVPKSPFNFKEKRTIIATMFGIPSNKIVQVRLPYKPTEILDKYDKTTAYITVVGKKDADRLTGKYFKKYTNDKNLKGYEDNGYVYIAPENTTMHGGKKVSGSLVRDIFANASDEDKKKLFNSLYPKFDLKIFKLITNKIQKVNEDYEYHKLIVEGGAYGHLSHFHDVKTNTFKDMKEFVKLALQGGLEHTRLKTDGINLMVSWIDGEIRAARNKGHLKNFGETSLTVKGVADKFSGRGGIEVAYVEAMNDLKNAISRLSEKEIEKIFKNGKKWMSLEVMYPDAENIINYGVSELRFHGTMEYDEDGNVIGEDKKDGDVLAEKLKKIKADKQKTFTIKPLEVAKLPEVKDFKTQRDYFYKKIDALIKKYKLKETSTIHDFFEAAFKNILEKNIKKYKYKIPPEIKNKIMDHWVDFNTYAIKDMKKEIENENFLNWLMDYNKKKYKKDLKDIALNFEVITLELGARILKNLTSFMSVNPDKVVQKLKKDLDDTIKMVQKSNDPKLIDKLNFEMDRLKSIGGFNTIVPEEGITFMFKGNFYKLTGAFAPLNQILGIRFLL